VSDLAGYDCRTALAGLNIGWPDPEVLLLTEGRSWKETKTFFFHF
jgi:hypothetical protein